MKPVTRPVLRWHGGKFLLAPWVVAHLPPHRVYVEPFGGAASVLLQKPRSYAEVYNDLDDEAVNLFRVLRDSESATRLRDVLTLTPFARAEFELSYEKVADPVERARRLVVRSFMGHGGDAANNDHRTGFRANSTRSGTTPAHDWVNYAPALDATVARLRGVIIEHRDACAVMAQHDSEKTLHYLDPPYVPETRANGSRFTKTGYLAYRHEMTLQDHVALLAFVKTLRGGVVLSGYPTALYDDALHGWQRVEREALADGARKRTEVLWINDAAQMRARGPLFEREGLAA